MSSSIAFITADQAPADAGSLLFVGSLQSLADDRTRAALPESARGVWSALLDGLSPGDKGAAGETWFDAGGGPRRLTAVALPSACSRHNAPSQPHAIAELLSKRLPSKGDALVTLVLAEGAHGFAAGCAVARALPLYSRKSDAREGCCVSVRQLVLDGKACCCERLTRAARGIRLAARLVDMPTSELDTDAFIAEAEAVAEATGSAIRIIRDQALVTHGLGGIYGVGKAAVAPPALVVLTRAGASDTARKVVWVGKGIVYDTGGLSIKTKTGMPGMKSDMGGAAGVLGGFLAAALEGGQDALHAVLCLAENAVGPKSTRPDDILQMYSGKTVEVNNTDAEGRLVLADGVAFAQKDLGAEVIVDMATLTGAQRVATGQRHAAIVCNDAQLEAGAIAAGMRSGDLVHPLPYCPEMFRGEFKSEVADMKNSVANRANAQSSCAAQFVAEHLIDYSGQWLHVDIAGPARREDRGTGYGVALLLEMFR